MQNIFLLSCVVFENERFQIKAPRLQLTHCLKRHYFQFVISKEPRMLQQFFIYRWKDNKMTFDMVWVVTSNLLWLWNYLRSKVKFDLRSLTSIISKGSYQIFILIMLKLCRIKSTYRIKKENSVYLHIAFSRKRKLENFQNISNSVLDLSQFQTSTGSFILQ